VVGSYNSVKKRLNGMFELFENSKNINDAKLFMGSREESGENLIEIKSPYSRDVVSRYPKCSAEDAKRALEIAKKASYECAKSPLHQRVAWLEDVADKLEEYRENIAFTIVNGGGKTDSLC